MVRIEKGKKNPLAQDVKVTKNEYSVICDVQKLRDMLLKGKEEQEKNS